MHLNHVKLDTQSHFAAGFCEGPGLQAEDTHSALKPALREMLTWGAWRWKEKISEELESRAVQMKILKNVLGHLSRISVLAADLQFRHFSKHRPNLKFFKSQMVNTRRATKAQEDRKERVSCSLWTVQLSDAPSAAGIDARAVGPWQEHSSATSQRTT